MKWCDGDEDTGPMVSGNGHYSRQMALLRPLVSLVDEEN